MSSDKVRDADATKAVIVKAAEAIFAEKGFAGTTIREISQASGFSGPLIMFHFQNKLGVYEAVKASIVQRYIDHHRLEAPPKGSFASFIEHVIASMFAFYRDNPTMIRLSNWARLEGDLDPWPGEDEWHHVYWDHIRQAQVRGEIRDDLSPLNISIMISGAIHIWWEYHAHFLKHLETSKTPQAADDQYSQQCLSFVLRGLSPVPSKMSNPGSETPASKKRRMHEEDPSQS
jgi:TetR/AcrR family transcriptional regulator